MKPDPITPEPLPADDAAWDALLDRALAPEPWSDTARQQTLAAITAALAAHPAQTPEIPESPKVSPVLARIQPTGGAFRIGVGFAAAAIVALAGAVVALTLLSDSPGVQTGNAPGPLASSQDPAVDSTANPADINRNADLPWADPELTAQLEAWSLAARETGLAVDASAFAGDALASADAGDHAAAGAANWWNSGASADADLSGLDPAALRRELDAFARSTDLVF